MTTPDDIPDEFVPILETYIRRYGNRGLLIVSDVGFQRGMSDPVSGAKSLMDEPASEAELAIAEQNIERIKAKGFL